MSRSIEVEVTATIWMSDIATEDLVEELRKRDLQGLDCAPNWLIPRLSKEFLLGDEKAVIDLMKELVRENGYPV